MEGQSIASGVASEQYQENMADKVFFPNTLLQHVKVIWACGEMQKWWWGHCTRSHYEYVVYAKTTHFNVKYAANVLRLHRTDRGRNGQKFMN